MENKKLTEEEVRDIKNIQDSLAAIKNEFGTIELLQMDLETRKEAAKTYLTDLKQKESELVKVLEETYGVGSIDLNAGEFIPTPTQPATEE
jgi:hypothetical protein